MAVDALPAAEIVHAIAGRTRLRIPARRDDPVFFAALATGLSTMAGVDSVETRPLTGSILVRHSWPLARLAEAAEKAGLFALMDVAALPPPTQAVSLSLDPRMALGISFGVLALLQLARGQILPQAATLAYYAINLTGLLAHGDLSNGDGDGDA